MNRKITMINPFCIIVINVILLLTACQPTPEKPVVENKGGGELEKAIMQTAPPQTEKPQDKEESTQELRISDTRINKAGTVTVNIDANVIPASDACISAVRLEERTLYKEELDIMIKVFFGDNITFYDPLVTIKADIEGNILYLQQRLTLDDEALLKLYEDKDMTDVNEIKKHINRIIEEQKKKVANVSEERPIIEELVIDRNWGGFQASVEMGREYMGHVSYGESNTGRVKFICHAFGGEQSQSGRCFYPDTATQIHKNADNHELSSAKEVAKKMIEDMGINGVRIGDMFISLDNARGTPSTPGKIEEVVVSDRKFFVFCLERIVGDRTIDFTLYEGKLSVSDYDRPVPYERIEVWVEDNKVVKFMWLQPTKVTEIINDSSVLRIDYEQALDLAVNHLLIKYAYLFEQERAESISADISSIEFEMVRIKEKDSKNHIVVPAWKIFGDIQAKLDFKSKYDIMEDFESLELYPNIVTINALDGSIIDMNKGY